MATIEKLVLSGSVNGRPIPITATGSVGNSIHTVSTSTSSFDEIWLYATNNSANATNLTLEFGNTGSADQIQSSIPSRTGLYLIVPGIPLRGNSTPPVVRAYAGTSGSISLSGWVNRIT